MRERAEPGAGAPRTGPAVYQAKLKRLLDLVVLLLDARRPLSFEEIRDQFPEYRTAKPEAGKRTFERDKADLLALGIPLEWTSPDGGDDAGDEESDAAGGYTIRRRAIALPPIQLSPEEVALLYAAASAARSGAALPYLDAASLALRKLSFDLPPAGPLASAPPVLLHLAAEGARDPAFARHLELLHQSVHDRRRLRMVYRAAPPPAGAAPAERSAGATERDLDPYGLVYRESAWVVVGYCHLRRGIRTFRVDRIVSLSVRGGRSRPPSTSEAGRASPHRALLARAVETGSGGGPDFTVPEGFSLAAHGARSPWRFETGPAEEVTIEIRPSLRFVAEEDFGPDARRAPLPDGALRVTFTCSNLAYLRERVLGARGELRIVEPAGMRRALVRELRALLDRHEAAPR